MITIYHAELKGVKIKNFMMPLIGTGRQGIDKVELLGSLLKKPEYLLKTSVNIQEIYLTAYSDQDAEVLNAILLYSVWRGSLNFITRSLFNGKSIKLSIVDWVVSRQ